MCFSLHQSQLLLLEFDSELKLTELFDDLKATGMDLGKWELPDGDDRPVTWEDEVSDVAGNQFDYGPEDFKDGRKRREVITKFAELYRRDLISLLKKARS